MNARSFVASVFALAACAARAADLPVSYLVDDKALKDAVAGTALTFELHADPDIHVINSHFVALAIAPQ
jgi:hypothetical protein